MQRCFDAWVQILSWCLAEIIFLLSEGEINLAQRHRRSSHMKTPSRRMCLPSAWWCGEFVEKQGESVLFRGGFFGFFFQPIWFRGTLDLLTSINIVDPYVSTNSALWKLNFTKDHGGIKSQVLPSLWFLVDLPPKNRSGEICTKMHLLSVDHKGHYRWLSMKFHQRQNFLISFWYENSLKDCLHHTLQLLFSPPWTHVPAIKSCKNTVASLIWSGLQLYTSHLKAHDTDNHRKYTSLWHMHTPLTLQYTEFFFDAISSVFISSCITLCSSQICYTKNIAAKQCAEMHQD